MKKIYFAGSIRGGRELAGRYRELIGMLRAYGHVYSEHVGSDEAISRDNKLSDREIHERDLEWIRQSDAVVAEVSIPSLGVGYEIASAIALGKQVLCLYDQNSEYRLSAMISGSDETKVRRYGSPEEAGKILELFMAGKL
jgi:nucleoside 2-deoxyribosyltransferase